jgi:hypothetical protein
VHFTRANVIHASGTFGGAVSYPFFDMSSGGSLAGTIAAEEKMLAVGNDRTTIIADEGIRRPPPPSRRPAIHWSRFGRGCRS